MLASARTSAQSRRNAQMTNQLALATRRLRRLSVSDGTDGAWLRFVAEALGHVRRLAENGRAGVGFAEISDMAPELLVLPGFEDAESGSQTRVHSEV